VRDEERGVATDTHQPPEPTEKSEEQSSRLQLLRIVFAVLALVVGLIVYSYADWPGSGYMGVGDKKIWDYLDLLIVPAALALGVYWLNRAQSQREREAEDVQQERELKAEEARRERELEVESKRAQDAALQAYLDQMAELLIDYAMGSRSGEPDSPLSVVARARTLTVLPRLDGHRKRSVLQFLYESGLIVKAPTVVDLAGADLRRAQLSGADLYGAYLGQADLGQADLSEADLSQADLSAADLYGAYMYCSRRSALRNLYEEFSSLVDFLFFWHLLFYALLLYWSASIPICPISRTRTSTPSSVSGILSDRLFWSGRTLLLT
jgi:hypothetical protein